MWAKGHALYFLYPVSNSDHSLITIANPAQALANIIQQQLVIEGYHVSGEAIAKLNREQKA